MDDATAADNCGEVTAEVSSETTALAMPGHHGTGVHLRACRLTVECGSRRDAYGRRHSRRTTVEARHHRSVKRNHGAGTTFTFGHGRRQHFTTITVQTPRHRSSHSSLPTTPRVPMPMDDATAADNCGEVTVEVSSETTAGDAAGNYVIVRTFTATTMLETALRRHRPSRSKTPRRRSSPSCLPTTRLSARTRCRWTTLWRRTTAVRSPSKCQAKPQQVMPRATT